MTLVANIETSGIKNTRGRHFAVPSFSDNQKEIYELPFGDTLSVSKCLCIGWSRTGYSCKRFLQLLINILPGHEMTYKSYTQKVLFLNLDLEVIPIANFDTGDNKMSQLSIQFIQRRRRQP